MRRNFIKMKISNKPKYSIATIFTNMENVNLTKDPGMIAYSFHKFYNFDAYIPISKNTEYPYKEKYFQDIHMSKLSNSRNALIKNLSRTKWIAQNAKKIDLLNLFFFDRWTWIDMWIYKLFNPNGKIYVHCDSNGERMLNYVFPRNFLKNYIIKRVLLADRIIDDTLWGIQNSKNSQKLLGHWPFKNLAFVPNGVYWESNEKPQYSQKENIILTVSNIGSPAKRSDLLLEAFGKCAIKHTDWKLKLIGPINEEFKTYINEFCETHMKIMGQIEFTGPIYDRDELARAYAEAKIFCLPSAWEGFSLAAVEALSKGCFILGSDIASNVEVTNNGEMGLLFESGNIDDFVIKMDQILDDEDRIRNNFPVAMECAERKYSWENVIKPIYDWFMEEEI